MEEEDRIMSHRHGMVLVESASGGYDTLAQLHQLAATDSESEGEEAVSPGDSSTSSGDDGSYHSDNDEIAEYWDPYCEQRMWKMHALDALSLQLHAGGERRMR